MMKSVITTILLAAVITSCSNSITFEVTASYYNPTEEQCGSDPLITADGSVIDLDKLNNGELRWIAISRELRTYFKYGDVVLIKSSDKKLNGKWIVKDTMNPRYKRRIDILTSDENFMDKPLKVTIIKVK